jgi:hypothetical protein
MHSARWQLQGSKRNENQDAVVNADACAPASAPAVAGRGGGNVVVLGCCHNYRQVGNLLCHRALMLPHCNTLVAHSSEWLMDQAVSIFCGHEPRKPPPLVHTR